MSLFSAWLKLDRCRVQAPAMGEGWGHGEEALLSYNQVHGMQRGWEESPPGPALAFDSIQLSGEEGYGGPPAE